MITERRKKNFWAKVNKTDVCWLWTGSTHRGRGKFGVWPKVIEAYRFSWIITFGPIENDLYVCHTCDNPLCVRPSHLFLGTQSDNLKDAGKKGRLAAQKYPGLFAREGNGRAKLTEAQVEEIRTRAKIEQQKTLAQEFGVSTSQVSVICRRAGWKEVL